MPGETASDGAEARLLDAYQQRLLREAAEWRLLGLLFECPDAKWQRDVAALAGEVGDPRLREAAEAAAGGASEGMYHAIFGPGGPVSPREVTYLGGVQFGYLFSELGAFYDAFAYRPATDEPHDHVAVEAGFVAYLALKEAFALFAGDGEHAAVTAEASARFRAEHLAMIAEPLARKLDQLRPCYLTTAADVLLEKVGPVETVPLSLRGELFADEPDAGTCCPANRPDDVT
jgi:hypothetical protein